MKRASTNGFTLIELLSVSGLVATVGLITSATFLNIMKGVVKSETIKEVKQNGDYAISTIERLMRNAEGITSACSGASTGSITILDVDSNTTTFSCVVSDGIGKIASSSASTNGFLTNNKVTLGNTCPGSLSFSCTRSANGVKSVTIQFSLSQALLEVPTSERATEQFRTTVYLRNE